jgi:ABC-type multidrug transport system fused ATPase/permease subunit
MTLVSGRILVNLLDLFALLCIGLLASVLAGNFSPDESPLTAYFGRLSGASNSELALIFSVIAATLFIIKSLFGSLMLRLTTVFLAKTDGRLSARLAEKQYGQGISITWSQTRGETEWLLTQSSYHAISSVLFSAGSFIAEASLFVLIFSLFVFVDVWAATFVTLYFLGLVIAFQIFINQRLRRLGERLSRNSVGMTDSILEMNENLRELSVMAKLETWVARFSSIRLEYSLDRGLQRFLMGLPRFFVEAGLMLGIVGVLAFQFAQGFSPESLEVLAVFLAGGLRIMAALLPLQNSVADLRTLAPQARRAQEAIQEMLRMERIPAVSYFGEPPGKDLFSNGSTVGPGIAVSGVDFAYPGSREKSLSDISFEIPGGSLLAVVGLSGSGKTTLVDLLMGLISPASGEVRFFWTDAYGGQPSASIVRGYLPQRPHLFRGSMAQNVAVSFENADVDDERVIGSLKKVGLWSFVSSLPQSIHSDIGKQASSLSGGQLQRLALARAIYCGANLLALDEPTSALDYKSEREVTELITSLGSSTTRIVIAHRASTVRNADFVLVLSRGRVETFGTYAEVKRKSEFFRSGFD